MNIINTNNPSNKTTFEKSIINSLPEFDGLWFPEKIIPLSKNFLNNIHTYSFQEMAFVIIKHLIECQLTDNQLDRVINNAFNFPIRVQSFEHNLFLLETFHGPTYTFKDFGARFLACYLEEYLKDKKDKIINILVSTSGDTGSAIAAAFYGKKNIKVTILYPDKKISEVQEIQMTTYGENITPICIKNDFDQCQQFVKRSFTDKELQKLNLISANSINLGRLLPQCLYYFYAVKKIKEKLGYYPNNITFSIPCGNCGNLTGGLIAKKLGLNANFIAAQNKNSIFVNYLISMEYAPLQSINTLSNAMDVGDPSNFKRIKYLYPLFENLKKNVKGYICSEKQTLSGIQDIWQKYNYIIDPHTSVAYNAIKNKKGCNIIVSTAHPMKFKETIYKAIGEMVEFPDEIKKLLTQKKLLVNMPENYLSFKNFLLKKNKSVTLIGMPGAGKSVISNYISENFNIGKIEVDNLIYEQYNSPLQKIITQYGEDEFKQIEKNAILSICLDNKIIISPGGSIIYSEKAMDYLSKTLIIYIKCSFETIKSRTENFTNRGIIFNGKTPIELFNERDILYQKYSDITIDSENLSIGDIGNIIYAF